MSAATASQADQTAPLRLERVIIVMRHGVRPPTKSAQELAPLAETPWPSESDWGAPPGNLTPHGAAAVRLFGVALVKAYQRDGLFDPSRAPGDQIFLWADSADQRTRATAEAFAESLRPGISVKADMRPEGASDPLFDPLDGVKCMLDQAQAMKELASVGAISQPTTQTALDRLQQIVAPHGCTEGPGVCLKGDSRLTVNVNSIKLSGPVGTGSTLAENILLEYEAGLPLERVGWGRVSRADLDSILPAHERASDLTRRLASVARARGAGLAGLISQVLGQPGRPVSSPFPQSRGVRPDDRLVLLVGHDTNLDNLAGLFGLSWKLPDQPDSTAPGTALAFERWRYPLTGSALVRIRVFYQTPDDVRFLHAGPLRSAPVFWTGCGETGKGDCSPEALVGLSHLSPQGCQF